MKLMPIIVANEKNDEIKNGSAYIAKDKDQREYEQNPNPGKVQ